MCRSMVDIQSPTAEIRRGKKEEEEEEEERRKKRMKIYMVSLFHRATINYRMKILWSALLHRATIIIWLSSLLHHHWHHLCFNSCVPGEPGLTFHLKFCLFWERTFGCYWHMFLWAICPFCHQPTVSKHWRKLKAPTLIFHWNVSQPVPRSTIAELLHKPGAWFWKLPKMISG